MESLKDKACSLLDNILDYVELIYGAEKLREMQQDPSLMDKYFEEYIEKQKLLFKKIENLNTETKKSFFDMLATRFHTKVAIQEAVAEHNKNIESILKENKNLRNYD